MHLDPINKSSRPNEHSRTYCEGKTLGISVFSRPLLSSWRGNSFKVFILQLWFMNTRLKMKTCIWKPRHVHWGKIVLEPIVKTSFPEFFSLQKYWLWMSYFLKWMATWLYRCIGVIIWVRINFFLAPIMLKSRCQCGFRDINDKYGSLGRCSFLHSITCLMKKLIAIGYAERWWRRILEFVDGSWFVRGWQGLKSMHQYS